MNNQEEMKKDELNAAPETAEAAGETEEKTVSPQEKTAEPAAEEAPEPVSYTHLRAHETGRNLVCRLLLEKKKKKNK